MTELTEKDLNRYRSGWKRRREKIQKERERRQSRAEQVAVRIASELREMGAEEFYFFGSLHEGPARKNSDLDIAVSGIPATARTEALKRAEEVSDGEFRLDLVFLDLLKRDHPEFVERIRRRGKRL